MEKEGRSRKTHRSSFSSSSASSELGRSTSGASANDVPLAGNGLGRRDSQCLLQQLRAATMVLFAALSCTLNGERDSAEECLSHAAEILATVGETRLPPRQATRGGLAPWQIREVTTHIETHLDVPIKSRELAAAAGLSPCHFSRVFRDSFGCSPLEYITRRRVERAQGLMLSADGPLSQIALDCGFADQAHFSRLFRRVVGESPRSWRKARLSRTVADATAAMKHTTHARAAHTNGAAIPTFDRLREQLSSSSPCFSSESRGHGI